jgi:hypothetical protein
MRGLKICLWITGISCLLAVFGMFLPISVCQNVAKIFGVEAMFRYSPVFSYALRTVAATYVGIGVFFVILAIAPMKYGVLVPFSAIAAFFLGLFCAIAGLATEMPTLWFMSDALTCMILGILIFMFWRQTKQTS